MEITIEEIQKKFESLPEDLKWAIMEVDVDNNIIDISKKHGLKVEQMGQLSLETHAVIFGYTDPEKFEESVKRSLQIENEKAKEIVIDINEKILKEIRKRVLNLHTSQSENIEESKEQPSKVPPQNVVPNTPKAPFVDKKLSESIEKLLKKMPVRNVEKPTDTINRLENEKELPAPSTSPTQAPIKPTIEPARNAFSIADAGGEKTPGILEQKLSGSFQIPKVETEHTLNNLNKDSDSGKTKLPQTDPYRMPIE